MSDTLTNALAQSQHSSTVLQGIMNPAQLNPLAGMGSAISAVSGMQGLQEKAAQQAAGQAYQGAINQQTGEFDPNKFRTLLAQSGPSAMAAGAALLNTQQISSDQLKQNFDKARWVNSTAGALLQSGDFSDAAMLGALHNGVAGGILTLPEAQRQLATMPPDAAGRQRWLQEHQDTSASFTEQMQQRFGTRQPTDAGGSTEYPVVPSPRAGGNVSVQHTPTPAERYNLTPSYIPLDASGKQTTPDKAVTWQSVNVPRQGVGDMPPQAPAPIVTTPAPSTATPPGSLPPNAPPPLPGQRLVNGRFQTPPATTPPATTAVPPATTTTTTPPAPVPVPQQPVVRTAPPQGQVAEQEASQKQFIADRTALPQRQTQEQNLNHAYDALKLVTSGRGTETASQLRNLLVTAGVAGAATANDEALYEIGRKYTERTIADAGNAGGTDTARAVAASSNPNVSLINPANLAFLRNDIGKVRQQMAAYMTAPDKTIGTGYGEHSANTASNTDYRGFNWDMYSFAEQKEIEKSVGAEGTKAHDALARAIGMGRALWPQKGAGPIVPHAQATPTMPPPNMLAMAQPPQNALQPA